MKIIAIFFSLITISAYAGNSNNVEYIDIYPADYAKIKLVPGFGPVGPAGIQYVKLIIEKSDGFGEMSTATVIIHDKENALIFRSQNYHHCSSESDKCFIEFNIKPDQLKNLIVEIAYHNLGGWPTFRQYRVKGLAMLTNQSTTRLSAPDAQKPRAGY